MLATVKKISTTAVAMLEERQEAQEVMDNFRQREREAVESLQKTKKLREHWEAKIREADRIRREAIGPRKITFATPSNLQPLTTPKENMQKDAEILNQKNEEIDIKYLRTLVASATSIPTSGAAAGEGSSESGSEMAKFDPWPVFFKREWGRNWPFLAGFAVTGILITKLTAGFTEEDLKNSKFVQEHKR
ncbi:hypothetical protein QYE76_058383 [Lolium multiflorum]|uniref:Uncharacterized protein n=2 Tax=Lolium TaxID=4520 RepID=A0AAD8WPM8_LOLMU|nr:hypothetical protein QYE76_058383 [Lolium multiflorum]